MLTCSPFFHKQEFYSSHFSHSVESNSLRPHGLQHTRLPCPSPTPGAYSNSCPSHQWCHPTISSSVVPFSPCLQSFPAIRVFSNESVLCIRLPKYLEKEMATHPSVLAWRIPGAVEPGGLPSMGSHRVGHDWSDLAAAAAKVLEFQLQHQSFQCTSSNLKHEDHTK